MMHRLAQLKACKKIRNPLSAENPIVDTVGLLRPFAKREAKLLHSLLLSLFADMHSPNTVIIFTDWCPFNWFRTSGDSNNGLGTWYGNLQTTLPYRDWDAPLSQPGCWAYPDMLHVGECEGAHAQIARAAFLYRREKKKKEDKEKTDGCACSSATHLHSCTATIGCSNQT